MSGKTIVASQEDYLKFKKLLQFFVWQSNKNADNGRAEKPTRATNPQFIEHYGLETEFNKIAGLDFGICFFMCGRFNTKLSTYINIELLNIIGEFKNGKIVALKNEIRLDIPSISISGDLRERCEERNKQLKDRYSLEELGIEKDYPPKISEANDNLKKMFDEYLKIYNDFYKEIKRAIYGPKEKHSSKTLEQEIDDIIKKYNETIKQDMKRDMQSPILYHYTNLSAFKKIVESKKLLASHIKYLNDKSEIQYALKKIFIPAIKDISVEYEQKNTRIFRTLKR